GPSDRPSACEIPARACTVTKVSSPFTPAPDILERRHLRGSKRPCRRRTMRVIALGLAVFGLATAASAQDIQKLKRTTKASKELAVQGHVNINDACEPKEPPEFDLDIPPKNGTVCTRSGMVRLASPWSDRNPHCIGRRINGVFVIYVPFGSFTG